MKKKNPADAGSLIFAVHDVLRLFQQAGVCCFAFLQGNDLRQAGVQGNDLLAGSFAAEMPLQPEKGSRRRLFAS